MQAHTYRVVSTHKDSRGEILGIFATLAEARYVAPRMVDRHQGWRIVASPRVAVVTRKVAVAKPAPTPAVVEPKLVPITKASKWAASEKQINWATDIRARALLTLRSEREQVKYKMERAVPVEAPVFTAILDLVTTAIAVLSADDDAKNFIEMWGKINWTAKGMLDGRGEGALGSVRLFARVGLLAKCEAVSREVEIAKAAMRAARFSTAA